MAKKIKSHVVWIDRELIRAQVFYCLWMEETVYKKEMQRLGIEYPDAFVIKGANATTHTIEHKDYGTACIVTMGSVKGRTLIDVYATLQHEAVHVWQENCRSMGEQNPSAEFEAYGIQRISLSLMHEFNKYLNKHKEIKAKLLRTV